jgi:hypothetical protein
VTKITNQVSLTLDIDTFNKLAEVAEERGVRPGGVARMMVGERLEFCRLGWEINDQRMAEILKMICSMNEDERFELEGYLRKKRKKS